MTSTSRATVGRETTVCMSLSGRPGVFGSRFHNHLYGALGLDWIYKAFTTTDLVAAIGGVRALGVRGCAISMPFKEQVIPLLDALAPSAAAIDSVNTIVNDGGVLTGHNTDYAAVRALLDARGLDRRARFVVRGSGGMAKAVVGALRDLGFVDGTIVARNEARGRALADAYGYRWQAALDDEPAALLLNATPLGMLGGAEASDLPFPEMMIAEAQHIVDVVAAPPSTPFVKAARATEKTTTTGDQIIVLQAVEQFVLYTGQRPSDARIAAAAAFALAV